MIVLDLAKQKMRNYGLLNKVPDSVLAQAHDDCKHLDVIFAPFVEEMQGVHADKNLSSEGRSNRTIELQDKTVTAVADGSRQQGILDSIERQEADSVNRLTKAKNKLTPAKDAYLASRHGAVWTGAHSFIDEARRKHEAYVLQSERDGVPLSDDEKVFQNPFVELYLTACAQGFTEKTAEFITAVEEVPFPMELVDKQTLEDGRQIQLAATSPELADSIIAATHRAAMYDILLNEIGAIVAKPMTVTIQKDTIEDGIKAKVRSGTV